MRPSDTAGFKDPPERAPIARPPTVTQDPIAKANISFEGFFVVATQSTTKLRTAV